MTVRRGRVATPAAPDDDRVAGPTTEGDHAMRADLRRDLTAAIKARDRVAVAALRSALAAIDNAEAVPATDTADSTDTTARAEPSAHVVTPAVGVGAAEVDRRELTDADQRAIVAGEVRERTAAAEEYARHGQGDAAERLRAEAAVLTRHLEGRA